MRELYVIEFESANYAGASETCMVWADSVEDAQQEFENSCWGEDFFREQDQDQYIEENGDDEGVVWSSFIEAIPLKGSVHEEFATNPTQQQFYQIVNEQ